MQQPFVDKVIDEGRHPGGRPEEYKPEYCETLIRLRKDGKSISHVAVELGVDKHTIYNWARKHKEFFHAFARGDELYRVWLYDKAAENFENPKFNDRIFKVIAATHAGWSDKPSEVLREHPGWCDKKEQALDHDYEVGAINEAQYETMQKALTHKFERENGLAILEAEKVISDKTKAAETDE